ncbi:MAG: peptidyl-prolyl cis-trans isomerase [Bacteroidota bacterium]
MMNSQKYSKNNFTNAAVFFVFSLLILGCSKEKKQDTYVAKVNESILTEEQVRLALSDDKNKGKYRSEYIHDWIETEVLFQEAMKNGTLDKKEFDAIIERSKKQLAAAMLINKVLDKNRIELTDDDVQKYFERDKEDFKLVDDAFRLNIIRFDNFDKAVKFRSILIETGWDKASNAYRNDKSILSNEASRLLYQYQIQPHDLLRVVNNLQQGEVSIVLETEPMKFTVVQLVEKLNKGVTPQLDDVKNEVIERLLVIKRKEFIRNYIDKLVADHNLEIKRYSE